MSNQTSTPQVLIRHISGSKKGQTETFHMADDLKIKIGRGSENQVSFDPVKEDVVSRNHCTISRLREPHDSYEIMDNQSRNGTYINDQRISGKATLSVGDIVRLGKDGPAFEFDLNPRPIQKTRVLDTPFNASRETKVQSATSSLTSHKETPKEAVGKHTMLNMLQESEKKGKKGLIVTILALLVVIGTVAWILFSRYATTTKALLNKKDSSNISSKVVPPTFIAKYNNDKVVYIEVGWKLRYTRTGEDICHLYLLKPGSTNDYMAAYTKINGKVEPVLVQKNYPSKGVFLQPIGGYHRGTGFVVRETGFIITNRRVAAAWYASYDFPPSAFPGMLVYDDSKPKEATYDFSPRVSEADLANWKPREAVRLRLNKNEITGEKIVDGENSYMDVTFANTSLRTSARNVRISNNHDVALIKIDYPQPLTKVSMVESKVIAPGMPVTLLGYPSISPDQLVVNKSFDAFNRNPELISVPAPSLSTGFIGRLITPSADEVGGYISAGDYYQLTINSPGPGNSGGPLYDDENEVIGIFAAGPADGKISFAIPIKYAIDLMGNKDVTK